MKTIDKEATEIYSQRKSILARKQELAHKIFEVALSRRGQRRTQDANDIEARSGPLSEARKNILTLGRRLGSEINQVTADYSVAAKLSSEHYASHADAYHQMAIGEAEADGVQVDFDGDIAVKVNESLAQ